jgi:hypothetical protein
MSRDFEYQRLNRGERNDVDEKSLGVDWSDSTQIIPTHTRSFIIYMSIFLISLMTNVLLVLDNARLRNLTQDGNRTKYSEFSASDMRFRLTEKLAKSRTKRTYCFSPLQSTGHRTGVARRWMLRGMLWTRIQ